MRHKTFVNIVQSFIIYISYGNNKIRIRSRYMPEIKPNIWYCIFLKKHKDNGKILSNVYIYNPASFIAFQTIKYHNQAVGNMVYFLLSVECYVIITIHLYILK